MAYPHRVALFCVGEGSRALERFGASPWGLLQDPASQELLLALADGPLTLDELRAAAPPNALKRLDSLLKHGLVKVVGDAYATTIPVVSDAKSRELRATLKPLAEAVAGIVEAGLEEVEQAYGETRLSGEFEWGDVAHIVVDALLLDLSMLSCVESLLTREGLFRGWTGGQLILPFFGLEVGPNMVNFGVNSSLVFRGVGASVMHGSMIRRGARGGRPHRTAIPMLWGRDKRLITEAVTAVAHGAAEGLVARYEAIEDAYRRLGYAEWLEGPGDFVELAIHAVMALSIEELVDRGALPAIPEEVDPAWGIWLWDAPWTLDYGALYRHLLEEAREVLEERGEAGEARRRLSRAEELARMGDYSEALHELKELMNAYRRPQARG